MQNNLQKAPESGTRKYSEEELGIIAAASERAQRTPPPESPENLRLKRLGPDAHAEWMGEAGLRRKL